MKKPKGRFTVTSVQYGKNVHAMSGGCCQGGGNGGNGGSCSGGGSGQPGSNCKSK